MEIIGTILLTIAFIPLIILSALFGGQDYYPKQRIDIENELKTETFYKSTADSSMEIETDKGEFSTKGLFWKNTTMTTTTVELLSVDYVLCYYNVYGELLLKSFPQQEKCSTKIKVENSEIEKEKKRLEDYNKKVDEYNVYHGFFWEKK